MKRQKTYTFLNIIGLSVGLCSFILIMLWVQNQFSFDKHHEHFHNVYRVGIDVKMGEMDGKGYSTSAPMADALVEDFPEVVNAARVYRGINKLITYKAGNKSYTESGVHYADPEIFDILTIPIIKEKENERLSTPNTIYITESAAKKYFGDEEPIGKLLDFDGWWEYEIVGVIADVPKTASWYYDFLASMHNVGAANNSQWLSDNLNTYILLDENADYQQLQSKLVDFRDRHIQDEVVQAIGTTFDQWEKQGNRYRFYLEPLKWSYLNPHGIQSPDRTGNLTYVIAFMIIGCFILLIACINFINLTTACSSKRAKEIGLRKVIGSPRRQIIGQLLSESVIYSLISLIIAVIAVRLLLPAFSSFTSTELEQGFNHLINIPILVGLALIVGVIAGSYSAVFVSSIKVSSILKGNMKKNGKNWLRNGLVLTQFVISIFIIICTFIVYSQLNYIRNKKLGFDKERVMIIDRAYTLQDKLQSFKEEILKNPDISYATVSNNVPGKGSGGSVYRREDASEDEVVHFRLISGDYDYLKTMGIQLAEGRYFEEKFGDERNCCLINETAVKALGLKNPIGSNVIQFGGSKGISIIGVVEDYHFGRLSEKIPNLIMLPPHTMFDHYFIMKIQSDNIINTVKNVEKVWSNFAPGQPIKYFFMDEYFEKLHRQEIQMGRIFSLFSLLAIFIASLGLFGLATFAAQQKTKEIGVRKVLGASVTGIIALLLQQFTRWVLLANLIAWPLAWYAMKSWLQNYSYAVTLNLLYFLLAGIITLLIAVLTVIFQTVKVATVNPVKSLKYE